MTHERAGHVYHTHAIPKEAQKRAADSLELGLQLSGYWCWELTQDFGKSMNTE